METLVLYHGSPEIVQKPLLEKGKQTNDYGQGFYCTEHESLACEWACTAARGGYANKYELDATKLKVLHLDQLQHPTLSWLSLLLQNRIVRLSTPAMKRGKEWIVAHLPTDISTFDVVVGYRADDSYFQFARAFLNNGLTLGQLSLAMRLGNLGEQYVLKSSKVFKQIQFVEATWAEQTTYYPLREARDKHAVEEFNRLLEEEDEGGILLRDLVDGKVSLDDERLR